MFCGQIFERAANLGPYLVNKSALSIFQKCQRKSEFEIQSPLRGKKGQKLEEVPTFVQSSILKVKFFEINSSEFHNRIIREESFFDRKLFSKGSFRRPLAFIF